MSNNHALLSGSTSRLLATFLANDIAAKVVDGELNLIKHQTASGEWRLLKGMVSEKLPIFSRQMCDDKWWTYLLFKDLGLPTPVTFQLSSMEQLAEILNTYKPVVIKPRSGAHGHDVRMNVTDIDDFSSFFDLPSSPRAQMIVQQQIDGIDIRLLVLGGRVVSALERRPAVVIGDGAHTVEELIAIENKRPKRGKLGVDTLVAISMPAVKQFLNDKQLRSIPERGANVRVVGPSNQSMGGTVHDVTDTIPLDMRQSAERLVRHLQMPIAGVDCIIASSGHSFLEVNVSPGIAIHDDPALGIESGCFLSYMELLYRDTWWRPEGH